MPRRPSPPLLSPGPPLASGRSCAGGVFDFAIRACDLRTRLPLCPACLGARAADALQAWRARRAAVAS